MAATKQKATFDEPGTLPKALAILTALGNYPKGARFTDLSQDTGLAVSTTHRVVTTLAQYGFVDYNEEQRLYGLGLRIFELSHKVATANSFSETALPVMKKLAESTGNMVLLNVFDRDHTLVIERAEAPQPVQVRTEIGARLPLHSTASGKAIVASLDEDERDKLLKQLSYPKVTKNTISSRKRFADEVALVAKRGFGAVNEENELGIRSVAVVIPSSRGQRRAALSLAAPTFMVSAKELEGQIKLLHQAAADIGHRLINYR